MKKVVSLVLIFALVFCFAGCRKENINNSSDFSSRASGNALDRGGFSSEEEKNQFNESTYDDKSNVSSSNSESTSKGSFSYSGGNIKTEKININSLDKLNFYAVKKAIAENGAALLSGTTPNTGIALLADNRNFNILRLAGTKAFDINPNAAFTITMYSYFTVTLNDSRGFLAQKLGGTGAVEVVITRNSFNNMITFKKGERYYSCLQSSLTDKAMSFSSHKYVSGFKLVENYDQENYEYTVYFDGDRVIGINCGRFEGSGSFKYVADDMVYNDGFCFVIHKKQSFTAEQLEGLFASNSSFADDGIVLEDGTVLFGEAAVTDNAVAFKNGSGAVLITGKDIKKISAMHSNKFGFCIKLELNSGANIPQKATLAFYLNNLKVRELTLQRDGAAAYITDLNNKSRLSDIFYKLTAADTSGRIGRVIDHNDFVNEVSKRLKLNDYEVLKEDHSASFGNGLKLVDYTYTLKTNKSISYKASNYDVTIDGITITMPIKVSDFLNKGFTVKEKNFDDNILQGGALFTSPSGNKVDTFIMNFYGSSSNFNDCYITQICFMCYEHVSKYQEGISPTRPDFEMLEGINKDSTLDDIISRLGEPNKIILMTTDNQPMSYKDCIIQLYYNVTTPTLPNGELVFNIMPVLNNTAPSDFLTDISFALQ